MEVYFDDSLVNYLSRNNGTPRSLLSRDGTGLAPGSVSTAGSKIRHDPIAEARMIILELKAAEANRLRQNSSDLSTPTKTAMPWLKSLSISLQRTLDVIQSPGPAPTTKVKFVTSSEMTSDTKEEPEPTVLEKWLDSMSRDHTIIKWRIPDGIIDAYRLQGLGSEWNLESFCKIAYRSRKCMLCGSFTGKSSLDWCSWSSVRYGDQCILQSRHVLSYTHKELWSALTNLLKCVKIEDIQPLLWETVPSTILVNPELNRSTSRQIQAIQIDSCDLSIYSFESVESFMMTPEIVFEFPASRNRRGEPLCIKTSVSDLYDRTVGIWARLDQKEWGQVGVVDQKFMDKFGDLTTPIDNNTMKEFFVPFVVLPRIRFLPAV